MKKRVKRGCNGVIGFAKKDVKIQIIKLRSLDTGGGGSVIILV